MTAMKQVEEDLRRAEQRASEELAGMVQLHELVGRLLVCPNLPSALSEVLDATIAITSADRGVVQLLHSGSLHIAAQRGFSEEYLERFASVRTGEPSASSRALHSGRTVVIEDVMADSAYAPLHEIAVASGYRGVQATPLRSRSGEILGVLSTHYSAPYHASQRDRRILDLYTQQATDFIERVRNVDALNGKTRQLEEEDERKLFFLATLGHELRNPLAALDLAIQAIDAGARTSEQMYPRMAAQIGRLKRLVEDLLEITRITRGDFTLRIETVDLTRIVRTAAVAVERSLGIRQQDLSLELEQTMMLRGDETRLEQVVLNLLDNASKYTPEGGHIALSLERANGSAVLTVRDDGRGIAPGELGRIFAPFAQTERGNGGLGIGLALVERIVKLHGGSVEVTSAGAGAGSLFLVRLPLSEADATVMSSNPSTHSPASLPASMRVLVVDDEEDSAQLLALVLQSYGVQTRCAYDAAGGFEQACNWRPQVALLDLGLPDLSGSELARRIRAELGLRTALIAITGFGDSTPEERASPDLFSARLVKPIDTRQLRELIADQVAD
jgi:signal transduction histidine kinase/CheY-like chemotaxis protein